MRRPTGDARDHEKWSKHRRRNAAEVIGAGAIKIQIGEELLFAAHYLLDALGDRIEPFIAVSRAKLFGAGFYHIGAGVGFFFNTGSEDHNYFFGSDTCKY